MLVSISLSCSPKPLSLKKINCSPKPPLCSARRPELLLLLLWSASALFVYLDRMEGKYATSISFLYAIVSFRKIVETGSRNCAVAMRWARSPDQPLASLLWPAACHPHASKPEPLVARVYVRWKSSTPRWQDANESWVAAAARFYLLFFVMKRNV